ncbi:MAG: antitoxin Xre-like helix-turn-helix domain-containing protein, partial [Beijerinckiaceae bacterium]
MSLARATHHIDAGPPVIDHLAFSPVNRRRLSGPGLRTFLAIADLWKLNEEQRRAVLGLPSRSTYHNWTRAVREHRDITLDLDALLRLSAVLGVHQALQVLHGTEADGI